MHGLVGSHIWMSYRINIIYAYIHIYNIYNINEIYIYIYILRHDCLGASTFKVYLHRLRPRKQYICLIFLNLMLFKLRLVQSQLKLGF